MAHASLFSGIGGPEVAAAWMGWNNLFHCEINPFGRKVLEFWFPKSKSYEDITKTNFTEWRGQVDVLTGGFPCQPFSYVGQRRGAADDRYLWPEMLRIIDEVRPAWVVGENVAGITTMVEPGEVSSMGGQAALFGESYTYEEKRERFTIERICADIEGIGYSVQPLLIPACAVGAPHKRDRVFIIGRRISTDTAEQQSERVGLEQQGNGSSKQRQLGGSRCKDGDGRVDTNSDSTLLQIRNSQGASNSESGLRVEPRDSPAGLGRWDTFPTVSPVHRGDDGLPFDVARLAIPFGKWRTEVLKACGNAIVPQVIYEIFRAIEIAENETKQQSYE